MRKRMNSIDQGLFDQGLFGCAQASRRIHGKRHDSEQSLPIWHKSGKALISRAAVGAASATLSAFGANAPLDLFRQSIATMCAGGRPAGWENNHGFTR
jgi:hypothetical protein